ncbi:hypothetical protein KW790_00200 [Candidatus Parcubacteria bacterium]|nr:hypothetical protein [Candidatus Parcubacteria bacterium]
MLIIAFIIVIAANWVGMILHGRAKFRQGYKKGFEEGAWDARYLTPKDNGRVGTIVSVLSEGQFYEDYIYMVAFPQVFINPAHTLPHKLVKISCNPMRQHRKVGQKVIYYLHMVWDYDPHAVYPDVPEYVH